MSVAVMSFLGTNYLVIGNVLRGLKSVVRDEKRTNSDRELTEVE